MKKNALYVTILLMVVFNVNAQDIELMSDGAKRSLVLHQGFNQNVPANTMKHRTFKHLNLNKVNNHESNVDTELPVNSTSMIKVNKVDDAAANIHLEAKHYFKDAPNFAGNLGEFRGFAQGKKAISNGK